MALSLSTVFNKEVDKNEVHFVNQQYDFLMSVVWDTKLNAYKLNCTEAEATAIGKAEMDGNFNLKESLKKVQKILNGPIIVDK